MYISSVTIENFRAFKEKTVFNFNPGVTVLVGENDCGKSTVKAEFAQQFSFDLETIFKGKKVQDIVNLLPRYLVEAIEYVTDEIEGI